MSLEILIGADVAPTASNLDAFRDGKSVLAEGLLQRWMQADVRLFNLETPLIDGGTPWLKCGPNLSAPTSCARGVAALYPSAVSLCNNHILDYGEEGLHSTIRALKAEGVETFGAGDDLSGADKPFVLMKNGTRIGVYAVCENEFSIATESTGGANPLNLLDLGDRIRDVRGNCDRLIVLYHGGREYYPYPSPQMQRICRKIAECGASLVLCQHSHCVGSYEKWDNATIVYGQGNFVFDTENDNEYFDTGLLVRYTIGDYGAEQVAFVPVVRVPGGAALAEGSRAAEILDAFEQRSLRLRMQGFVEARYRVYAAEVKEKMLKVIVSGHVVTRSVNVLCGRRPSRMLSLRNKVDLLNSFRCESIRELLTEGLYHDVF
jgi:poly-gamma-glutamate synthesis protein (capsule biosynthesis protein)